MPRWMMLMTFLLTGLVGAEQRVLLTAFGPFAGRGVNGSATVAKYLEDKGIAGAELRVVVIPVGWGEPEKTLPTTIADFHPDIVLGLGEGFPNAAAFERVAVNRSAGADENGRSPSGIIAPDGATSLPTRLACDPTWFDGLAPLRLSDDAGTYLCNNLLYVALQQPVAKAGFLHLPPQGDVNDTEYAERWVPVVLRLLEHQLRN
jgi:pyroglutamyl-peptidase